MSKRIAITAIVLGLSFLGAACKNSVTTNTAPANENANTAVTDTLNSNSTATINTNTPIVTGSAALQVAAPGSGEKLVSPYELKGASTHSKIYARVNNAAGRGVFTESANVRNGSFTLNLTFIFTSTETGSIDVYALDSAGKEIDAVKIPVIFKIDTRGEGDTTLANTNTDNNTNLSAY